MMEPKETMELWKEALDLIAFLLVTPEIFRHRIQAWFDDSEFGSYAGYARSIASKISLKTTTLCGIVEIAILTILALHFIPQAFDVFKKLHFTSWQTILSVIVLCIIAGIVGIPLSIKINSYSMTKEGVGRVFLAGGLTAFFVARLVGVASTLEPTTRTTITNLEHAVQEQDKNLLDAAQELKKNQGQLIQELNKNEGQLRQQLDEMKKELLRTTYRVDVLED
jgi:hypothetical protein